MYKNLNKILLFKLYFKAKFHIMYKNMELEYARFKRPITLHK